MDKFLEILKQIPVVNLIPMITSVLNSIPNAWNDLSEEQKKEVATNLILAASKAAKEYGSK